MRAIKIDRKRRILILKIILLAAGELTGYPTSSQIVKLAVEYGLHYSITEEEIEALLVEQVFNAVAL